MAKLDTRYWHSHAGGGIDLFRASNFSHEFKHHFHEEWVIAIYEDGIEHCKIGKSERFTKKGDIHLIPPFCSHSGKSIDEKGWSYRTFYPSIKLIGEILGPDCDWPAEPTFYRSSKVWSKLRNLHITIEEATDQLEAEEAIISVVLTINNELLNAGSQITGAPPHKESKLAAKVRAYIDDKFEEDISISGIAAKMNCSSEHLVRSFSSKFGITPHAYIVQLRLLKAKYAIKNGATSVEAAIDAGFSDQPHLIRHFRRMFGITPGHYIKNVQY